MTRPYFRKLTPPIRKCRICAEQFQPKAPSQFLCSRRCFKELHDRAEAARIRKHKMGTA